MQTETASAPSTRATLLPNGKNDQLEIFVIDSEIHLGSCDVSTGNQSSRDQNAILLC